MILRQVQKKTKKRKQNQLLPLQKYVLVSVSIYQGQPIWLPFFIQVKAIEIKVDETKAYQLPT